MIIEVEDLNKGKTIGAIRYSEFDEYEGTDEIIIKETSGNLEYIDIDFDDIFNSNEEKIRVGINTDHFLTLNYETIINIPDNCKNLIKELNSYCALLKHYYDNNYRDVWVLIQNYFGHIDYGEEFGYFKTHDEICDILLYNFFISHEKEFETHFEDFCNRQITKIKYNLKEKGYELEENYIEDRINGKNEVY